MMTEPFSSLSAMDPRKISDAEYYEMMETMQRNLIELLSSRPDLNANGRSYEYMSDKLMIEIRRISNWKAINGKPTMTSEEFLTINHIKSIQP